MKLRIRSSRPRTAAVAGLLLALAALGGSGACDSPVPPRPGLPEWQEPALWSGSGVGVNLAGGNLLVRRADLDLDTRLGPYAVGAVYNSATGSWLWSFDVYYDGALLIDASGARHATAGLAPGAVIPGTSWVVVDARTVKTKGGLVHEFDAFGRLASVRWSSSAHPRLVFESAIVASARRTTAIHQEPAPGIVEEVFTLVYDGAGRLVRIDDRAGRRAELAWDAQGRLAAARDGLDVERGWPGFRYEYSGNLLAALTKSEGERTEIAYEAGRVTEVRTAAIPGPGHRFGYWRGAVGWHTVVRDPLGHESTLYWDAERRVSEIVSPLGERVVLAWNGLRIASRTEPSGETTEWIHEGDDRVEERQPSGNVVRFTHAPGAENRAAPDRRALLSVMDDLGSVEQRAYDAQGRLVASTNGAGETTHYAWGSLGEMVSVTTPSGLVTDFADHGEHGHPTRITSAGRDETRVYDAVGNLVSGGGLAGPAAPGLGGVVSRSFDADRNLASVVLQGLDLWASGEGVLGVEWRSDGRPSRILRPYGGDSEFVYDAAGRLVARRDRADGAWHTTTLDNDVLGRTTALTLPNGMRREIGFDAAGRVEVERLLRHGVLESEAVRSFSQGRPVASLDSTWGAPESLVYDAAGRVASIAFPGGETLEIGYDLRSRVVRETYRLAGGLPGVGGVLRVLDFERDGAGREVEVRDGGALLVSRHLANGRLVEARHGNGLVRTWSYAEDGLVAASTTVNGAGAIVESTSVVRDGDGAGFLAALRTLATTSTPGLGVTTLEDHQLLPAPQGAGPHPGPRIGFHASDADPDGRTWVWDELSNLTQTRGDEVLVFEQNAEQNRLLEVRRWLNPHSFPAEFETVRTYLWDEAGFATERGGVALHWDAGGRPAAIGSGIAFTWDVSGRLVRLWRNGVERRVAFGGRVVSDAAGSPLSMELGEVSIDLTSAARHFRHHDFRGNVKFVSDETGAVVAHNRFGPFGLEARFGSDDGSRGFAQGRELGDLLLLGPRLFDSAAARFLAPDPVYQLVHQHAYALGNPIWFWDPGGAEARPAAQIAAGLAFAGFVAGVTATLTGALAANPAIALVGIRLTLFSYGALVGFQAPPSAANVAGAVAIGGTLATLGTYGPIAGLAASGFAAGQLFQIALGELTQLGAAGSVGSGNHVTVSSPFDPASVSGSAGGGFIKLVEIHVEGPGSSGAPGCASLPDRGRRASGLRWRLSLLVGVQIVLALLLLRARARQESPAALRSTR